MFRLLHCSGPEERQNITEERHGCEKLLCLWQPGSSEGTRKGPVTRYGNIPKDINSPRDPLPLTMPLLTTIITH